MATLPSSAIPAAGFAEAGQSDSLSAIFAAAHHGDERAFAALYRRFAPVVHGIVLSRSGPTDAEDVVQEVFMSVHRALAGVRDPQALAGWIASIARNAATDRLRRRRAAPVRVPLGDVPSREAPREEGDLRARILSRIQELPDAYREALVLRLVEGLAGPAIAERTGMTPASVRVHLHRGMAMLRPLLERDGWR